MNVIDCIKNKKAKAEHFLLQVEFKVICDNNA